jgi:hypothetical protein
MRGRPHYYERPLIAGAAVAGLVMMGGGNAFAGEVTGNGKPTPVANPGSGGRFVAGSICAFNGLDDGSETGNPVTPGVVQSFGSLAAGLAQEAGGAGSFAHVIHDEGPGTNCHGFASGGGDE